MPARATLRGVMTQVIYALTPGVAAYVWYFGPGVLIQIALAAAFALGFEAASLALRGKPQKLFLGDFSAVVTAILFALTSVTVVWFSFSAVKWRPNRCKNLIEEDRTRWELVFEHLASKGIKNSKIEPSPAAYPEGRGRPPRVC